MVRTRLGSDTAVPPVLVKKMKKKTRAHFLTVDMIRKNGDHQYHKCLCCSQKLHLKHNWNNWLQCPQCQDVYHSQCLFKWCLKSYNPSCPKCRLSISFDLEDTSNVEEEWSLKFDIDDMSESENDSENDIVV